MRNHTLTKNFNAEAVVNPYRIVKFGAADDGVIQGAAVGDALIGVTDRLGGAAINDPCDVIMGGIAEVEFGGTITRGALVTTDSVGKAVAAAPAAGVNNSVIGRAMVSGVDGDIGSVHIAPGQIQGA